MSDISDLTHLLSGLSVVQFGTDSRVSTGAQNKNRVDEAVAQARSTLVNRELTMVESYYFAGALRHQASLEPNPDTERELELEAFGWYRKVFFDAWIPDAFPPVRKRTLDELERPRVADELLGVLVGPYPPLSDQAFADHLATYLWTVGDRYWPSMFRYALDVANRGDFGTAAGLQCDLVRRSANIESSKGEPAPATLIWAAQSLRQLAKETRRLGDLELAADYANAAKKLGSTDGWRQVTTSPCVDALTEAAIRKISGKGAR